MRLPRLADEHGDPPALECPEGVLVGGVVADVDRKYRAGAEPLLGTDEVRDRRALVPVETRPEIEHHLAGGDLEKAADVEGLDGAAHVRLDAGRVARGDEPVVNGERGVLVLEENARHFRETRGELAVHPREQLPREPRGLVARQRFRAVGLEAVVADVDDAGDADFAAQILDAAAAHHGERAPRILREPLEQGARFPRERGIVGRRRDGRERAVEIEKQDEMTIGGPGQHGFPIVEETSHVDSSGRRGARTFHALTLS